MTELEKSMAGELYNPGDPALCALRRKALTLCEQFNRIPGADREARAALLRTLLGTVRGNIHVESDFYCDYGCNIHVGDNFYANHGCVMLDEAPIRIGDNCLIGPQVGLYTAGHPLDPVVRNTGMEFAKPITLGDSCWIGGHATILPGVTLGDNVVVAAGAVVTKSFGSNVAIGGNPARVLKTLEA